VRGTWPQAAAWCQKNVERLVDAYPETSGLYNREADSWRMLFKFGDAAGGRWPELARQTALAIKHGIGDDPGEGVMLLQDIKAVFEKTSASRLTTASLLTELHNCIERPWGKKSMSDVEPVFQERQLAAALRPYGIKAKQLRMGNENRRGFMRSQFEDAWSRYLRDEESDEDVADEEAA